MERPDRFDPYRILGVPPGAPLDEVKAAYRRLAKRHHPDAAGPGDLARFLTVQAAYETIARSRGTGTRGPAAGSRTPGPAARGSQRDAGRDWYAAAREAARARSRAGRGQGAGPRARGGGAAGAGRGPSAGGSGPSGSAPHQGAGGHAGRAGRPRDAGRDAPWQRKATLGSTTYDDAPEEPPTWHGAGWYGAASGTYWTVNPREYADPRKHGPEYLGRTTEWTGDRPVASFTAAGAAGTGEPAGDRPAAGPAGRAAAPDPGDRRPGGADAPGGERSDEPGPTGAPGPTAAAARTDAAGPTGAPGPTGADAPSGPPPSPGRPAGLASAILAALGVRGARDPRVR